MKKKNYINSVNAWFISKAEMNHLKKIPSLQADNFSPLNFFEFFKNHYAMLATKQKYTKVLPTR